MSRITTIEGVAIEQGSDNPYADLGYPGADEMLVKAGLAHEIGEIIKSRHLTQQRAAELLAMPQPKLSATPYRHQARNVLAVSSAARRRSGSNASKSSSVTRPTGACTAIAAHARLRSSMTGTAIAINPCKCS